MLKNVYPYYEVAIVGKDCENQRSMFEKVYHPNKLVLGSNKTSDLPLLHGKFVPDVTLFYVCVNRACQMPTESIEEAVSQIK
jgi:uncharacterized protein YyaL (SSP411 family)